MKWNLIFLYVCQNCNFKVFKNYGSYCRMKVKNITFIEMGSTGPVLHYKSNLYLQFFLKVNFLRKLRAHSFKTQKHTRKTLSNKITHSSLTKNELHYCSIGYL